MVSKTKISLLMTNGLQKTIEVTDYDKFLEQVRFRSETTVLVDEKTNENIFALSVMSFRKMD